MSKIHDMTTCSRQTFYIVGHVGAIDTTEKKKAQQKSVP